MSQPYEISYIPFCRPFEGNICHMYLDSDTPGNVTTGNGFLIPSATAACTFPFYLPGLHTPATAQEIAAEYWRVKAMPSARPASFYDAPSALQLKQEDIDAHLLAELDKLDEGMAAGITNYPGLPDSWKMALIDMAFNLGLHGLLTGYPEMLAAVQAGDGATAALQCHRNRISAARNAWAVDQFNSQENLANS